MGGKRDQERDKERGGEEQPKTSQASSDWGTKRLLLKSWLSRESCGVSREDATGEKRPPCRAKISTYLHTRELEEFPNQTKRVYTHWKKKKRQRHAEIPAALNMVRVFFFLPTRWNMEETLTHSLSLSQQVTVAQKEGKFTQQGGCIRDPHPFSTRHLIDFTPKK